MYTMYPPEDEDLWLETCRGIIFYKIIIIIIIIIITI